MFLASSDVSQRNRYVFVALMVALSMFHLTDVSNNILNIILYGHDKLSFEANPCVLNNTIKYIHETKRFEG